MAQSAARRTSILVTLCVPLFMAMLDNTVVNTALPSIQRSMHGGVEDLQWIIDGYSLTFAALMLTAATIGDIHGRKKVFLAGLALFTGGSAMCALSNLSESLGWLLTGRVVQGAGAAAVLPGTLSILRHVFTGERERGTAIGIWAGVSGLGLGLGPVIGGPLTEHFHWPSVFWINVPVGLLGLVAAALLIPESADPKGRSMDWAGLVLATLAVGGTVFATIQGPVWGWSDARIVGVYAGAAVALALFTVVEARSADPLLDPAFLRDRIVAGALLAGFAVYFGMFAVLYFLSLWLQLVLGWSPTDAGLAIMPAMVVVGVVSPLAGWLSGRTGGGVLLLLGLAVSAVTLYFFTWYGAGAHYSSFWWLIPLVGLGMGLTLTPITTLVLGRAPAARSGMASATSNTARELGGVMGVAALGSVLSNRMGSSLSARLNAQGVPPGTRDGIVTAAKSGGGTSGLGSTGDGPIGRAVQAAFVDGLHLAERSGAVVLGVAAVLTIVLVRRGSETTADAPAPPVTASEGAPRR